MWIKPWMWKRRVLLFGRFLQINPGLTFFKVLIFILFFPLFCLLNFDAYVIIKSITIKSQVGGKPYLFTLSLKECSRDGQCDSWQECRNGICMKRKAVWPILCSTFRIDTFWSTSIGAEKYKSSQQRLTSGYLAAGHRLTTAPASFIIFVYGKIQILTSLFSTISLVSTIIPV